MIHLTTVEGLIACDTREIVSMNDCETEDDIHFYKTVICFLNKAFFVKETISEIEQKIQDEKRRIKIDELMDSVNECQEIIKRARDIK